MRQTLLLVARVFAAGCADDDPATVVPLEIVTDSLPRGYAGQDYDVEIETAGAGTFA